MNSRSWGPDRTPGDGSPTERRTTGADAPLRTGSARPLIAWVSLLLTLLCLVLALVGMRANGLLLLATVFAVVLVWAVGGFRSDFWAGRDE
ncbi:hypothetical protein K8F61_05350 [Microbacterium resistens]|uniref:Uncharacterized protein n=1 Tax=Microbacterium resistens TaxID=156977 RepID=A0ABY3RXI4_9MICO|nr:hypothetical protein [Microbacterium resistens]UGS27616.1 hypothetical protein K8F61_05350 [Microbacterium resistens]